MEKVTVLRGVAVPMLLNNVNTDLIAPTLVPGKPVAAMPSLPLKEKLFANLRYDQAGRENPGFVLNQPRYRTGRILLTGSNFGCGSSRETAVWALMEFGITCVIASGFGEIFYENACQNGLLPVTIDMDDIRRIAEALDRSPASEMTVDLPRGMIEVPGLAPVSFTLPADRRTALLEGLDQLTVLLRSQAQILEFERKDAEHRPWIYDVSDHLD